MMKIYKLPMPENVARLETGAVQFGDDWPGVFIRGDHALHHANNLSKVIEILECNDPGKVLEVAMLKGLLQDLRSCIEIK